MLDLDCLVFDEFLRRLKERQDGGLRECLGVALLELVDEVTELDAPFFLLRRCAGGTDAPSLLEERLGRKGT